MGKFWFGEVKSHDPFETNLSIQCVFFLKNKNNKTKVCFLDINYIHTNTNLNLNWKYYQYEQKALNITSNKPNL